MVRTPRKSTRTIDTPQNEVTFSTPVKNTENILEQSLTPTVMKVNELRAELAARGLPSKGLKKELVERLEEALKTEISEVSIESMEENNLNGKLDIEQAPCSDDTPKETTELLAKKAKTDMEYHSIRKADVSVAEAKEELLDEDEAEMSTSEAQKDEEDSVQISKPVEPLVPKPKMVVKEIAPTTFLHIFGFVRPFTLQAAKSMIEKYGICKTFWMDLIKSQAYVEFEDLEMTRDCKLEIDGKVWPEETGKRLTARYSNLEEMQLAIQTEKELVKPKQETESKEKTEISDIPKRMDNLDQHFLKTEAAPHLYYKPAIPIQKQ